MLPIYFISYCPLGQHICVFMHWGHNYHSMFPLYLLFAEAGRGHHLEAECYESPKKEITSHAFEQLIHILKTHNRTNYK